MKTILPWLVAVLAVGGVVYFYKDSAAKSVELTKVQAQVQELETLRGEIEQLKQQQVSPDELVRLKEGRDELIRLRNQVRLLTAEKSQLTQQAQAAQSAAEQARAVTQAQNQVIVQAQQQATAAALSTCLNQLRQLSGAKQQWALEHQKTAEAVPGEVDIAPYLTGQTQPACPGGGKYALNNMAGVPTCSVPGHSLPPATQ